jgi:hypothetical protein
MSCKCFSSTCSSSTCHAVGALVQHVMPHALALAGIENFALNHGRAHSERERERDRQTERQTERVRERD